MTAGRGIATWGFGVSLGPDVVPNEALAERLSVDAAWIEQRTGIRSRRWGGNTEQMALESAR
ncbi:MAG: 3-oxoacyl-ACP synthase, partial [Acidimicrobiales bacterium]